MRGQIGILFLALWPLVASAAVEPIKLIERVPDPNGSPRPFRDAEDVPLRTSIYFELAAPTDAGDAFPQSVSVGLQADQGDAVELLRPGGHFAPDVSGWVRPSGKSIAVYIETGATLKPSARYTVHVSAAPTDAAADAEVASWSFTTEPAPSVHSLDYQLDLARSRSAGTDGSSPASATSFSAPGQPTMGQRLS